MMLTSTKISLDLILYIIVNRNLLYKKKSCRYCFKDIEQNKVLVKTGQFNVNTILL